MQADLYLAHTYTHTRTHIHMDSLGLRAPASAATDNFTTRDSANAIISRVG